MPVSRWTDKQKVVYPYNGIVFSQEKEQSADVHYNMMYTTTRIKLESIIVNEISQTWNVTYNSFYMKYPEKANP